MPFLLNFKRVRSVIKKNLYDNSYDILHEIKINKSQTTSNLYAQCLKQYFLVYNLL